jgi:hypothetical protein
MHLESRLDRIAPILGPGKRGQRDRGQPLRRVAPGAQCAHQLIAIALGHADVAHQNLRHCLAHLRQCIVGAGRLAHPGTGVIEQPRDQRAGVHVVLHYQHVDA